MLGGERTREGGPKASGSYGKFGRAVSFSIAPEASNAHRSQLTGGIDHRAHRTALGSAAAPVQPAWLIRSRSRLAGDRAARSATAAEWPRAEARACDRGRGTARGSRVSLPSPPLQQVADECRHPIAAHARARASGPQPAGDRTGVRRPVGRSAGRLNGWEVAPAPHRRRESPRIAERALQRGHKHSITRHRATRPVRSRNATRLAANAAQPSRARPPRPIGCRRPRRRASPPPSGPSRRSRRPTHCR